MPNNNFPEIGEVVLDPNDKFYENGEAKFDLLPTDIYLIDATKYPLLHEALPYTDKDTYFACVASTRPWYFEELDFEDQTLTDYDTLFGQTYAEGLGVFLQDRSGTPASITASGSVSDIIPYLESGIETYFYCDESINTRSTFYVTLTSDNGDTIQIRHNEWGSSLDTSVRYNGSQVILFNNPGAGETTFRVTWTLVDGVLSNDNNGQTYDAGIFNTVSAHCKCYCDDVGGDAVQTLKALVPYKLVEDIPSPSPDIPYKVVADLTEES